MSRQPLAMLALFFHAVWLSVFAYFLWVGRSPVGDEDKPSLLGALCEGFKEDAIKLASELGRLDVVSLSLTVLGVVLALAALSSFFMMRHAVIETAREEAEKSLPSIVSNGEMISALTEKMKSDPVFMTKLHTALSDDMMTDEAARDISEVIGEES